MNENNAISPDNDIINRLTVIRNNPKLYKRQKYKKLTVYNSLKYITCICYKTFSEL